MDALTYLRADHESVLGMLEVMEGAPRGSGAHTSGLDTMVANLVIAESQHEAIEEQLFWPMVRQVLDDGDELADAAVQQEETGKRLLQRLHDGAPGETDYHDALDEFAKLARDHIAFEQDIVWPKLSAAVSREDLDKLGAALQQARKVAPTRPHPDTPSHAAVQTTIGTLAGAVDHIADAVTGRSKDNPPDPQVS